MNVVIVALDHQTTRSIPNHVVMHGAVDTRTNLADGGVKASTVLDDIVNPVVRNFSAWGFALHDLHHCAVGLQMADVPDFIVENLGCIADGEHR